MPTIDFDELEVLDAFGQWNLESLATQEEIARFQAAARATDIRLLPLDDLAPCETRNRTGA